MPLEFFNPVSNISPFTYRDGETYLQQLKRLRQWIDDVSELSNAQIAAVINQFDAGMALALLRTLAAETAAENSAESAAAAQALADLMVTAQDDAVAYLINLGDAATKALDARKPTAFDTFIDAPNGTIPDGYVTLSGHVTTKRSAGGTEYKINNGTLVHDITSGITAAYLATKLPADVRESWFEVKWTNTGNPTDEIAVMVVSENQFTVDGYSDAGAHVFINRTGWTYQVFHSAASGGPGPISLATAGYGALDYDMWYKFGITYDGTQPTLHFPNGSTYTVAADARITDWWGPHITVESFSTGNNNAVAIKSWTASSDIKIERPISDISVASLGTSKYSFNDAPETIVVSGSDFTVISTVPNVSTPPSKALSLISQHHVTHNGAGALTCIVDYGGNETSRNVIELIPNGQTYSGILTVAAVLNLSEFFVGMEFPVQIRMISGGTTTVKVDPAANIRQTIIVQETQGIFS